MTALEQLTKPAETLTNPAIERWKEKGGKGNSQKTGPGIAMRRI